METFELKIKQETKVYNQTFKTLSKCCKNPYFVRTIKFDKKHLKAECVTQVLMLSCQKQLISDEVDTQKLYDNKKFLS